MYHTADIGRAFCAAADLHDFYANVPDQLILEAFTGSTRTFAALHKTLIKLDKHALAVCRFRKNSTPDFAVLIPQEETFTDNGGQDQPPGFHVILLPFADDIRKPPKNMTENLSGQSPSVPLSYAQPRSETYLRCRG